MKLRLLTVCLLLLTLPRLLHAQNDTTTGGVSSLLNLSLEELMNVKVVTATGNAITVNEAPSTMNVITAKQIKERGYEQLEDALRDIPGIDFIHTNGYVPTLIYFRGMYGAENLRALLMINGIPENNIIGSNDMAGPAYSLQNVERIEIVWGPASALYGANAFGGVINIITKTGDQANGFQYQKGYGSFNTSVDRASFGINKNNFDISISGSLYSTDGPRFTNRDPNYTASYVDKAYSLNFIISYAFKKAKLSFGTRIFDTPMGFGTFLNSPTQFLRLPSQGNGNVGTIGLLARDVRGEKSGLEEPFARTYYLQHEYKPSQKFNLLSRFVYRETGIAEDSYGYITIDGRKLYRVPTTNYSNRLSGELIGNYNWGKKYQLSAGLQYFQDNIEHGDRKYNLDNTVYFLDGRDTLLNLNFTFKPRDFDIRNTFGSYAQFVWNTNLLKKTSFTFGARYDNNNYYGAPVSPRFAMVSQPTDKFTFKLLFGTAYRAPTNTEIYQAPPGLNLKTEKAKTYELNLIYHFSSQFLGQINAFHNDLRDIIILGNLVNLVADKNPGKITTNGIEARMEMAFAKSTSGFFNFTYISDIGENYLTSVKRTIPGISKIKGNLGITTHVKEIFSFNFTANYVGKRNTPVTDPYGPVKGYLLGNITLTTDKFFDKRVSASIGVRNLFNTTYLDPGFRAADGAIYSTVLEQPGINGLVKFTISL